MNYVIDTSILFDMEEHVNKTIEKVAALTYGSLLPPTTTTISHAEYWAGFLGTSGEDLQECYEFLSKFQCLTLSPKSAKIWAELRNKYISKGKELPIMDLLIAAIAIEHDMCILTKDKDFQAIKEVQKIVFV